MNLSVKIKGFTKRKKKLDEVISVLRKEYEYVQKQYDDGLEELKTLRSMMKKIIMQKKEQGEASFWETLKSFFGGELESEISQKQLQKTKVIRELDDQMGLLESLEMNRLHKLELLKDAQKERRSVMQDMLSTYQEKMRFGQTLYPNGS